MPYYHPYEHFDFNRVLYNNTINITTYRQSRWVKGRHHEDDNNVAMRRIRRQGRLKQVLNYFNRSSVGRPLSTLPERRRFPWVVDCIHIPEQHHGRCHRKAPWTVLLRFMFVDIRQQLKDHSPTSVYNWRSYQTEPLIDRKVPSFHGKPGRRVVFSQDGFEHGYRMLKGDWMVTTYVWGESLEWLASADADVGKLVTWGNAASIRGYRPDSDEENSSTRGYYRIFYDFERQYKGPPCRFLFMRPPGYVGLTPLAVMFGTPLPARLEDLCGLMDTNLKVLLRDEQLHDEHKLHESRPSREEEDNLYGTTLGNR